MESHQSNKSTFCETLASQVSRLYDTQTYHDVTVKVGDAVFPCHKIILILSSKYFEAMFKSGMKEETNQEIQLKHDDMTTPNAFLTILQYMYKGKMDLNDENVLEILLCASYLRVDAVEQICVDFLKDHFKAKKIPITLFLETFLMASEDSNLEKLAVDFAAKNLSSVVETEEFLELMTTRGICLVLDSPNLEMVPERFIASSVTRWLKHKEERLADMSTVYQHLKLGELSPKELQEVFREFQKSTSPDKEEFILTIFHLATNAENKTYSEEVRKRYPQMFGMRKRDQVLTAIDVRSEKVTVWKNPKESGHNQGRSQPISFPDSVQGKVLAFDEESQRLFVGCCDVYTRYGTSRYNGRPYLISRSEGCLYFQRFDPESSTWNALPKPNFNLESPFVVALKNKLFVIDSPTRYEIFDESLNQWLQVKRYDGPLKGACISCTSFQGLVWVLFGSDDKEKGDVDVYTYDPMKNVWGFVNHFDSYRKGAINLLAKVGNHLFNCLSNYGYSKCKVYDICCGWEEIPQEDIPCNNSGPPAISIQDEVYIVLNGVAVKTDIDVDLYRPFPVILDEWKKLKVPESDFCMYTNRSLFSLD